LAAYITTCFADWQSDTFRRGVMRIRNGKRTDEPIRRPLRPNEVEGVHYYVKADPDFDRLTYSRCHRSLRRKLQVGDRLFFRTLWRGKPYIIGYGMVSAKSGPADDPICHLNPLYTHLIDFRLPVTAKLVMLVNPEARRNRKFHFNAWVNVRLGRNYYRIRDDEKLTRTGLLASCVLLNIDELAEQTASR
jgi:hypothetical protein